MKTFVTLLAAAALFAGCVPTSQLKQSQAEAAVLREENRKLTDTSNDLQNNIAQLKTNISALNEQIETLNSQNSVMGKQATNDQNRLNQSQGNLQVEQERLLRLQKLLAQQRAKAEELKNKMTDALNGFNSSDLVITQKNGKVYVTLSENLLFPSGSALVTNKGAEALAKLASVLNVNPDITINVEGHTDTIPIRGRYQDNWDLSTSRADAIVRILVNNYKVDPTGVIASGHSKFDPVDTNTTPDGRARNRRIEIILSPKLDEMYKLLSAS